jgi:mannose-1-phosphate guanylyltransferase
MIREVDSDATITIATSESQIPLIENQLGDKVQISIEPCRRDTFPAIALAVAYLHDVQGVYEDEAVVVCPVDPYVEKPYFETIVKLQKQAQIGDCLMS